METDAAIKPEYFEWELPKFHSIRDVLETADAIRDELIKKFNESACSEHLGKSLALRSRAPKPYCVEEVNMPVRSKLDELFGG